MKKFNLIDDPWIKVISKDSFDLTNVGLKELFENSNNYLCIYGDTRTQDFAILRLCLSVLHTVFSRYDYNGDKYDEVELDEKMIQVEDVDEEDYEDYKDSLLDTWKDLWTNGEFPKILFDYLDKWHDSFYLYDDEKPFYQVNEKMLPDNFFKEDKNGKKKVSVKNLDALRFNLKLAQSGNKQRMFPLSNDKTSMKYLKDDEVARWLVAFQGYSGAGDKRKYSGYDYKEKVAAGWLSRLGGIYLSSDSLFKTLLLNLVLFNPNTDDEVNYVIERPSWERDQEEIVEKSLNRKPIKSRAELYTNYARAFYIDPSRTESDMFKAAIIKLMKVDNENNFVEPMTIYRAYKDENSNLSYRPIKHSLNKSLWRNFNLLINNPGLKDDNTYPGVMNWLLYVGDNADIEDISINSVSMLCGSNKASLEPLDEITDSVKIDFRILNDSLQDGWRERIMSIIEKTTKMIDYHYKSFLKGVGKSRNLRDDKLKGYVDNKVGDMYFTIDKPFKDLISNIKPGDLKDEVEKEWLTIVRRLILNNADEIIKTSNLADFKNKGEEHNIIELYNQLNYRLKM